MTLTERGVRIVEPDARKTSLRGSRRRPHGESRVGRRYRERDLTAIDAAARQERSSSPRAERESHLILCATSAIDRAAPWDTRLPRRRVAAGRRSHAHLRAETTLRPPNGAALVNVNTAAEMHRAVEQASLRADALVMAAAVADFRPETTSPRKLKKSAGQQYLDLRLVRNPDILASITRPNLLKIGFAAETENLLENAAQKLRCQRSGDDRRQRRGVNHRRSKQHGNDSHSRRRSDHVADDEQRSARGGDRGDDCGLARPQECSRVVIYQGRSGRGATQIARSQLAVRLGIAVYAALCAAAILRCAVLILELPESVSSVGAILSLSSPIVRPLTVVASREPSRGWGGDPFRFDCYALAACTATRAAQSAATPMTQGNVRHEQVRSLGCRITDSEASRRRRRIHVEKYDTGDFGPGLRRGRDLAR